MTLTCLLFGHSYLHPVSAEPGWATMTCHHCLTEKRIQISDKVMALPTIQPYRVYCTPPKPLTAAERARARLVHEAEPRSRVSRFPQRGER